MAMAMGTMRAAEAVWFKKAFKIPLVINNPKRIP